jgi:hypothetical protein
MDKAETKYSDMIPGDSRNYEWAVRFDIHARYLGITQFEGASVKERVLLSPDQVAALMRFLSATNP